MRQAHAAAREVRWHDTELKPVSAAFHYRRAADHVAARIALERVAIVSVEGPSDLGERADFVVGSTQDFLELLRQL